MKLARVIGNVVATRKFPCYQGLKVLIVQPVDESGNDSAPSFLACDTVNAGPGDVVLVQQAGGSAPMLSSESWRREAARAFRRSAA